MSLRNTLISLHLYLAALLSPLMVLVAISGGLWLAGHKGEALVSGHRVLPGQRLDTGSPSLAEDVAALLVKAGLSGEFDKLQIHGGRVEVRHSGALHYRLRAAPDGATLETVQFDWQARMVALLKGLSHKALAGIVGGLALGVLALAISGLVLGLGSRQRRKLTVLFCLLGLLLTALLGLGLPYAF